MTRETGGRKQSSMSPCAACKLLRRRCASDCVFAPYFPADDPQKFANVHRVFGASNVNKMLQDLPLQNRADAVSSMVYEANARVRDPVYGCVGAISSLQHQVYHLQKELAIAHAEVVHLRLRATAAAAAQVSPTQPQKSAPVAAGAASDKSSVVSAGGAAHKSDSSCEDDRLWNPPCVLDLAASCFH